ncbi:MAG: FIST N-terminal domain-containing protein [Bacteroidota bacterium]
MTTTTNVAKTKTGTAYSQNENSFEAGVEIAKNAIDNSALLNQTIFLLFATPTHDAQRLIKGMRSVIGDGPSIIGGTTIGVVTNEFLSYSGVMAGAGFISSNENFFVINTEAGIKDRELDAGTNLGKTIKENLDADSSLLLLYDCMKFTHDESDQLLFNLSIPILEGVLSQIKEWPANVAGVGVIGDMTGASSCAIWANDYLSRHGLASVTISGPLKMDTVILQGTTPAGGYHTITKTDHNRILEIDGKPALEMIDEMTGGGMSWDEYPLFITLGANHGDKFGEYVPENYSNRFCLAIDKEAKALIMVENDLKEGDDVQLMRRDVDFKYIQPKLEELKAKLDNRKPVFAIYIDCIGRVSAFSGMPEEESLEVIRHLGNVPLFGIFSGVEIANIGKGVKPLDWTGVVCLFSVA